MTMPAGKSAKASAETAPPADIQALLNLLLADPKVAGTAGSQGGARARDAGDQGADLRDADDEAVEEAPRTQRGAGGAPRLLRSRAAAP